MKVVLGRAIGDLDGAVGSLSEVGIIEEGGAAAPALPELARRTMLDRAWSISLGAAGAGDERGLGVKGGCGGDSRALEGKSSLGLPVRLFDFWKEN